MPPSGRTDRAVTSRGYTIAVVSVPDTIRLNADCSLGCREVWRTSTSSAARKVVTADGLHVLQYYPPWSTVEVNVQRLRERGQPELADALIADLDRIAGRRLT